ncbi:MAG: cyclodeaminase/cyclohydrolase family protein [Lachnospiraceae bacterium]|nr:cyclodeaminase/cyclohydrolase family protein [Lachnospiraceae bacterium]
MEDCTKRTCREFVEVLASPEPTPGGGGAAALVGAVGAALGNMVGSLTVGKKRYADVEEKMRSLMEQCTKLQNELLDQVKADAEGFLPLAHAYSIPKDDPTREQTMEEASLAACDVPIRIMELCSEALLCMESFAKDGPKLAVSDAACGAVCLKAAMQAASLSILINTKSLKDRDKAEEINARCDRLLFEYEGRADRIYQRVRDSFIL